MNFTRTHHKPAPATPDQLDRGVVARAPAHAARPVAITSTLLWAAQILLAAFFVLVAAMPKLKGSPSSVQEFGLIGAGQWLRYLVGTAELAGGIGLLTPGLAGPAAAGLAADMAGATIINATVLRNTTYGADVWITTVLFAVFVLLAYGRRQQIKGLGAAITQCRCWSLLRRLRLTRAMAADAGSAAGGPSRGLQSDA